MGPATTSACAPMPSIRLRRVLAATEVYVGMTTERADRPAFSAEDAAAGLRRLASTGVLESRAIRAVLVAAGHGEPTAPAVQPARNIRAGSRVAKSTCCDSPPGDSRRARSPIGCTSRPKTADHHIQHIYDKIGVSTRAAAALWAMQNAVVG